MHAFLHVPKTGGTTIKALLQAARRRVAIVNSLDDARALAAEDLSSFTEEDGVAGHMPMAIGELFPTAEFSVFLRDPVDRLVSAYLHVARVEQHPAHRLVLDGMSASAYARTVEANSQVRRLATYALLQEQDGRYWWGLSNATDRALLDQAKDNLTRCAFVGFYEHFEEDVRAWSEAFAVPIPATLPALNVASNTLVLDENERRAIEDANALDRELYEFALTLRQRSKVA